MFYERFKAIRQASGKTQKELADFLNISPQSVSKWEKGETLPSIEYLPLMAKFFSCSINAFFEEVYENTLPEKMAEQIQLSSNVEEIKRRISSAFSQLKLNVEILDVYEGKRIITLTCVAGRKTKRDGVFAKCRKISDIADEKICMRSVSEDNNSFVIEVAKKHFDEIPLTSALESEEYKKTNAEIPIIIGYDTKDALLISDLAVASHILIYGDVHSGKTTFLRNLLTCLTSRFTKDEIALVVSDVNKRDMLYMNEFPHLLGNVLTSVDEAERTFNCLAEEMEARCAAFEALGVADIGKYNAVSQNKMKRIVIVIDEIIDLLVYSNKIYTTLSQLSMNGRKAGIHLIIATAYAHGKLEPIRISIPTTALFFTEKPHDCCDMIGMGIGNSLAGRGDMVYCSATDWGVRAQAPYIESEESLRLVKYDNE